MTPRENMVPYTRAELDSLKPWEVTNEDAARLIRDLKLSMERAESLEKVVVKAEKLGQAISANFTNVPAWLAVYWKAMTDELSKFWGKEIRR